MRLYAEVYQSTDNATGKFDDGFLNFATASSYYFSGPLGSIRTATDPTGNVCFDADYYPYGEENDYNTTCAPEFRFAGMEYDSETGNYYDHARYYNPRLGRFMTPDPSNAGAVAGDPQSWNGYAYVTDNPETLTDPSGRHEVCGRTTYTTNPKGQLVVNLHCHWVPDNFLWGLWDTFNAFEAGAETAFASLQNTIQGLPIQPPHFDNTTMTAIGVAMGMPGGEGLGDLGDLVTVDEAVQRASSAIGDQSVTVASNQAADEAADKFLGPGKQPLIQNYGSRAGQQIGWKSADGTKLVIDDTSAATPHYNFHNLQTGGNLHVNIK